jgi:hypothetical protein
MAHICSNCETVFSNQLRHATGGDLFCPIKGCGYDEVREVDDILVDLYLTLEGKGYYLGACDSGHPHGVHATCLHFANNVTFPFLPNGFECYDDDGCDCRIEKSYCTHCLSGAEMQKAIFDSVAVLIDWAVALPLNEAIL